MAKGNSRAAALAAKLAKPVATSGPKAPSLPSGDLDASEKAGLQARVSANKMREQLAIAGISLQDFIAKEFGDVHVNIAQREIKTPYGTYNAVRLHISHQDLIDKCVIDAENVRDASERTEESLRDIIDEIGEGYQLSPAISYIMEGGLFSFVDGSRRRESAIIRGVGLDVEVLDEKPSAEALQWMVAAADSGKDLSFYAKGNLFFNMMKKRKWTQADLVRNSKYNAAEVSRCASFFTKTPSEVAAYLDLSSCTIAQVDALNKELAVVSKFKATDELLSFFESEKVDEGDNAAVVSALKRFSQRLANPKARQRPKPEALYNDGNRSVDFSKKSKAKSVIEFKNVTTDELNSIKEYIADFLRSSATKKS